MPYVGGRLPWTPLLSFVLCPQWFYFPECHDVTKCLSIVTIPRGNHTSLDNEYKRCVIHVE